MADSYTNAYSKKTHRHKNGYEHGSILSGVIIDTDHTNGRGAARAIPVVAHEPGVRCPQKLDGAGIREERVQFETIVWHQAGPACATVEDAAKNASIAAEELIERERLAAEQTTAADRQARFAISRLLDEAQASSD